MKHETFNKLVGDRVDHCMSVLIKKDQEYSSGGDRLHNFKVAKGIDRDPNETALEALWGMLRKHLVSIMDLIEESKHGKVISKAMLDEKIGDYLNYGFLMEGLFVDANADNQQKEDHKKYIVNAFEELEKAKEKIAMLEGKDNDTKGIYERMMKEMYPHVDFASLFLPNIAGTYKPSLFVDPAGLINNPGHVFSE